jgi:hypothetical protein
MSRLYQPSIFNEPKISEKYRDEIHQNVNFSIPVSPHLSYSTEVKNVAVFHLCIKLSAIDY